MTKIQERIEKLVEVIKKIINWGDLRFEERAHLTNKLNEVIDKELKMEVNRCGYCGKLKGTASTEFFSHYCKECIKIIIEACEGSIESICRSEIMPEIRTNNMGAITKEEIEEFAKRVLGLYGLKDWKMEWTTASPSICMKDRKIIFIEERYIGKYPWDAKENILHEIAHIFTDDMVHGMRFYIYYIRLLNIFMGMNDE